MTVKINVTCEAAALVDPRELTPFQGELKWLEDKNYKRLARSLVRHGFSFPVFAWKRGRAKYVIDAHQRLKAILKMLDDGWTDDDDIHKEVELVGGKVPVDWIKAKDEQEAKQKVLLAMSQFGKYDEDSIYEFVSEAGLRWDDVKDVSDFPAINMGKLEVGWFRDDDLGSDPDGEPGESLPEAGGMELRIRVRELIGMLWNLHPDAKVVIDGSGEVGGVKSEGSGHSATVLITAKTKGDS